MAVFRETLLSLLERAMVDADFLRELSRDPLGIAHAMGVQLSAAELKQMLGMPEMTDEEMVEVLRVRITRAHGASCNDGDCEDCLAD